MSGLQLPLSRNDALLARIQGNILKGHGRDHGRLVFFRFLDGPRPENRLLFPAALKGGFVTSAADQLVATGQFKRDKLWQFERSVFASGFWGMGLTVAGLRAAQCRTPVSLQGPGGTQLFAFNQSMRDRLKKGDEQLLAHLNPPGAPEDVWSENYAEDQHGVWIVAHDDPNKLDEMQASVRGLLQSHGAEITGTEQGFRWRESPSTVTGEKGIDREPFGFRDGISAPHFIEGEKSDRLTKWSRVPLDQVLICNPGADFGGSFMVLRKLEQNVRAFLDFERSMAVQTAGAPTSRPLSQEMGAMVIGRDREGQPLEGAGSLGENDFSFKVGDDQRCPFHAHIRKAHPRDDSGTVGGSTGGLRAQLVRRSLVYDDHPAGRRLPDFAVANYQAGEQIERDAGLLFMAYMSNIRLQFETMHLQWMPEREFPELVSGHPDLLARPDLAPINSTGVRSWTWGIDARAPTCPLPLQAFVRPRGGDYFYVPSLPWLETPPTRRAFRTRS